MVHPRISVAIPVFNEALSIESLVGRVLRVLDAAPGGPHEVVITDDGSSDATLTILEQMAATESRLVVVALSRNFGHQAALSAALDHVAGDVVVLMDGDGQDPPEEIPRLIQAFHRGHDVVYAIRSERKESLLLRTCYALFYRFIGMVAEIELPTDSGDFGLMSRRVVDLIRRSPERHRYLRGLRTWVGFRQIGIEVNRAARMAGDSKYSLRKLLHLAFDGVFSFSVIPIRMATMMGILTVTGSAIYAVYSLHAKLFLGHSPKGFTTLYLAISFFGGVQLLFLGIIGEYVGRIYGEVKQRPLYIVDRVTRA